jgi:pentatricopeptide repeat protein
MLSLLSGTLQPAALCSPLPSYLRNVDAIKACGRDATAALALLAELRSSSSADVYTYATAVSVCGKGDRWQEAIGLLDSMEADGLAPDRACFNAALAAAARSRRPAEARALLKRMVDRGLEPAASSYVAVARAAMHANEFHAALATIEELRQSAQPLVFPALQVELVANEGLLTQTDADDGPSSAARHQRIAELVSESLKLHQATPLKKADATWLWRLYARTTLRAIRTRVATGTGLSSSWRRAVDLEATSRLLAALSASASSGEMPRFDEAGALAGYTTFHLINRAGKVADLLRVLASSKRRLAADSPSPSTAPSAVASAVAPDHGCSGASFRAPGSLAPSVVVSLGGGPAYDFAALAMLRAYEGMEAGTGEGEPIQ